MYLYAHSNSKQLSSIDKKLGPGEIIIATNLAGRGTNIKVTDEVNASGGLLCLMTFLARNRRVELQAFGRTARGGSLDLFVAFLTMLQCQHSTMG